MKDFNIAETEEDISTYAGYVGKILFVVQLFDELFTCSWWLYMMVKTL